MLSHAKGSKKIWYALAVIAAAIIIVAGALVIKFAVTDSGDRSVSAQISSDTGKVKAVKIDDSTKHANVLYNAKIEDVTDTAKVEELFEAMALEDVTGEYTVEISQEDESMVLTLNVTDPVQKNSKKTFNSNVKKYAQQMLVLIPQIDTVQWTYQIASANSQDTQDTADKSDASSDKDTTEIIVSSIDKEKFESTFGKAPEDLGKSADKVKLLLEKQAGK